MGQDCSWSTYTSGLPLAVAVGPSSVHIWVVVAIASPKLCWREIRQQDCDSLQSWRAAGFVFLIAGKKKKPMVFMVIWRCQQTAWLRAAVPAKATKRGPSVRRGVLSCAWETAPLPGARVASRARSAVPALLPCTNVCFGKAALVVSGM